MAINKHRRGGSGVYGPKARDRQSVESSGSKKHVQQPSAIGIGNITVSTRKENKQIIKNSN